MVIAAAAVALMILGGLTVGYAATATGATVVTVSPAKSMAITLPSNLTLAYAMEATTTTNMSIVVDANSPWTMSVVKDHDLTLAASSTVIPSSQLTYSSTVSKAGTGVSETQLNVSPPTYVVTGGTMTGEPPANVTVTYRLWIDDTDPAGTYTATHTYTATAP